MTAATSRDPPDPPIFCVTCGRPLGEELQLPKRRTEDWYGVRLQIHERYVIAALVTVANVLSAGITVAVQLLRG